MIEADRLRPRHMLDAAVEAVGFVQGRQRGDLDSDRMLLRAVVRCLEIVGEASVRLSEESRAAVPTVPWRDIAGMRNRLIHAYYSVNCDIVWTTFVDDLPPLIAELRAALSR